MTRMTALLSVLFFAIVLNAASPTLDEAHARYDKQEYEQACALFEKAAEKNDPSALRWAGLMHELGQGCDRNVTKAFGYYERSAKLGDPEGHYNLARLYQTGRGTPRDMNASVTHYAYAADKGIAAAQHNLARIYGKKGTPHYNPEKAFFYFSRSAAQNKTVSYLPLALMYVNGEGTAQNPAEAAKWFRKSWLETDNADAQFNLGLLYARGLGVVKNDVTAYALWFLNAGLGHKPSLHNLDVLTKRMKPEEIHRAQELARDRQKLVKATEPLKKLVIPAK